MLEAMKKRRSIYALGKNLPVSEEKVIEIVENTTRVVPDAFDMKSQRVVVAMGGKQDQLWDEIYNAYEGKVAREKIDSFKAGYGTVLYFIDEKVIQCLQKQFGAYADNFPVWANQSNGMLQYAIWTAFAENNIGASLQHYNPVIDEVVRKMFDLPETYKLVAQMPFGNIEARPEEKAEEEISNRVKIVK